MVAVSGGCDSVALLRAVAFQASKSDSKLAPKNLLVAHINHATRPESSEDEAFVRTLADELGVEFVVGRVAEKVGSSFHPNRSEDELRQLRYQLLVQLAGKKGVRYLFTGHQKQDQVETILFRIFRGTGLAGLHGIPETRLINPSLTLVRPFLKLDRERLEQFLKALNQSYRTDSSNLESKYTRNFLRNEMMPMLVSRFGDGIDDAVLRLSQQATESQEFLMEVAQASMEDAVEVIENGVRIQRAHFTNQRRIVVQTMLTMIWQQQNWPQQKMDARWWSQLAQWLIDESVESTKIDLPHGVICEVDAKQMVVYQSGASDAEGPTLQRDSME